MKTFKWTLFVLFIILVTAVVLTISILNKERDSYREKAIATVNEIYLDFSRGDVKSVSYKHLVSEEQRVEIELGLVSLMNETGRYKSHKIIDYVATIKISKEGFWFPIYVITEVVYENVSTIEKFSFSGSSLLIHNVSQKII